MGGGRVVKQVEGRTSNSILIIFEKKWHKALGAFLTRFEKHLRI